MPERTHETARSTERTPGQAVPSAPRWFSGGLIGLAALLVVNTLLGPLGMDRIPYPFSDTVRNETIGLEAVSLLIVAPICAVAGVLAARGRRVGTVLALGPAGYTGYMFVQYVAGPGYPTYTASLLLHVGIFALAGALLLGAWTLVDSDLTALTMRQRRRWALVLGALAVFVLSRWLDALVAMRSSAPLPDAYASDAGMYWSIFLLDIGVMVPALFATCVALWSGRRWAQTALYALVGWFALVPPSVAAMGITKVLGGDPHANPADVVVLSIATVLFAAVAVILYRPLFRSPEA